MTEKVLHHRGNYLVRRLRLAPSEATPWHCDPFHRVTVILSGDALAIEYGDEGVAKCVQVNAGQVDWDEPTDRIHRAVNVGGQLYEEITIFFLDPSRCSASAGGRAAIDCPEGIASVVLDDLQHPSSVVSRKFTECIGPSRPEGHSG